MPSRKLFLLLLLAATYFLAFPSAKAWQYGTSMQSTTSQYDSIEMPTRGMYWSTAPVNYVLCFWESSTTTDGVFVQNGYIYNGFDASFTLPCEGAKAKIPAHSWGMFWCYIKSGVCYGDCVLPPSGWQASHRIYYSIAVYPSSGCVSFKFTNVNKGQAICYKKYPPVSGKLSGNVGNIAELIGWTSGASYGNIYVDRIALWAQVISTGRRNSGPTYVYDYQSPSSVLIYIYADNVVQLGFNSGIHYPGNTLLWSTKFSANNEFVPPDP